MTQFKRPVSVLVVIHTSEPNVLLLERALHPGYWQSVTGSQEDGESLIETAVREVREETGVVIDEDLEQLVWRSSRPRPNRLLLFAVSRPVDVSAFPAFEADAETQERGLIFGPDGLDDEFAFVGECNSKPALMVATRMVS